MSSFTNVSLIVVGAVVLTPADFGNLALVVTTYALCVGVGQAVTGETALAVLSRSPEKVSRSALYSCQMVLAAIASAVTFALCAASSGEQRVLFALLGGALPGLMLQDAVRLYAFYAGEPSMALKADAAWLMIQSLGFAYALCTGQTTALNLLFFWALGAVAGALLALRGQQWTLNVPLGVRHLKVTRQSWPYYLAEFCCTLGMTYATTLIVAGAFGTSWAGGHRLALAMLGPTNVLLTGIKLLYLPRLAQSSASLSLAFLPALTAAYGLVVLAAGALFGGTVFPEVWRFAQTFLPYLVAQASILAFTAPFYLRIRSSVSAARAASLRAITGAAAMVLLVVSSQFNPQAVGVGITCGAVFDYAVLRLYARRYLQSVPSSATTSRVVVDPPGEG